MKQSKSSLGILILIRNEITPTFFLYFAVMENLRWIVLLITYYDSAEISCLMSISDGLGSYIFPRKMENTRPMIEEKDGKVFNFRRSWSSCFVKNMNKVFV